MPITFDPAARRIILDSASVTASQVWSRWADWTTLSDNSKYLSALKQVGGDDLGGGLSIPPYFFLLNNWRIRPMESAHDLAFSGNMFVDGGGNPFVQTLGTFQVNVRSTVAVQAQGISTGGSASVDNSAIANAILSDPRFLKVLTTANFLSLK